MSKVHVLFIANNSEWKTRDITTNTASIVPFQLLENTS